MSELNCNVHYEASQYSQMKKLTEKNIERILEAKRKRIELGSNHRHLQVDTVPNEIDCSIYGVHLEPCYKRYLFYYVMWHQQSRILSALNKMFASILFGEKLTNCSFANSKFFCFVQVYCHCWRQ